MFAFTLIFAFFPFSFALLEVITSLLFSHNMWVTFVRKGTLVFGLCLPCPYHARCLVFSKMFAFAFAKFICTFDGVREECERSSKAPGQSMGVDLKK